MTIVFDCFSLSVLSRSSQFVLSGSSELVRKTRVFDCLIGLSYSRHILSIFVIVSYFYVHFAWPLGLLVQLVFHCLFMYFCPGGQSSGEVFLCSFIYWLGTVADVVC